MLVTSGLINAVLHISALLWVMLPTWLSMILAKLTGGSEVYRYFTQLLPILHVSRVGREYSAPYNPTGGNNMATCAQLWPSVNSAQEQSILTSMPCYVRMASFLPGCSDLCMDKWRYTSLPGPHPYTHSTVLPCPSEHTLGSSFMSDAFTFFMGSIFHIASSSWSQNPSHLQPIPLNMLQESFTTSTKISQASHWLYEDL